MGRLEIRLCGARNIGDIQKVGTPDPYVRVQLGDNKKTAIKFKTPVVDNDLDPTFNQLFKFQIADPDRQQVRFELWNDNIFKDDLMGSYDLALNGLERGVVKDYWAILSGTKLQSAELHLRVLAVDFGLAPSAGAKITDSIENDGYVAPPHVDPKQKKKDSKSGSVAATASTTTTNTTTATAATNTTAPPQQPQYAPLAQQSYPQQPQYAPPPQQAPYPPQGYPPQQPYPQQPYPPAQQGYAPPPPQQGYYPPQGYPPQGYAPPPQGYAPPPPQGYPSQQPQGYYQQPPPQGYY